MQRCLELAAMAANQVAPNPMVGAVLVHNNTIIGEGYHRKYGQAHAEVNCINSVPAQLRHLVKESTLYVSLEPCNHFGKTAPCTDLILENNIPRVVIGCTDTFEKVNGSGIQRLKNAGVDVVVGIMENAARLLNKRFFTFHEKHRPYIILKWAQSDDGIIAKTDRSPVKISNEITDRLVHKWRTEEAAIMAGTNTVLHDDPSLTARLWPGQSPVRVVIDKELKLPRSLKIFDDTARTIILNHLRTEHSGNNYFTRISGEKDFLKETIEVMFEKNISSLIVEGGTVLLQSFIDAGYWDEARVITNKQLLIGEGIQAPVLKDQLMQEKQQIRSDEIVYYSNTKQLFQ